MPFSSGREFSRLSVTTKSAMWSRCPFAPAIHSRSDTNNRPVFALVLPFGITVTYFREGSSCLGKGLGVEADHEPCQVLAGEGPLERSGGLFIALLEGE